VIAKDIPLIDIALIRFIPPPAAMAPFGGAPIGVISIYTKKWDEGMAIKSIAEGNNHFIIHGYSVTREYYSPDYSRNDTLLTTPDNRTTLYWNGPASPDNSGSIHFTFYNSDQAKRFRIIIEGVDNKGRLSYSNNVFHEK
jgi:hypothetical protein